MKSMLTVLGALALGLAALAMPLVPSAQDSATQNQTAQHHHYKLIDVGTLGGPNISVGFAGYVAKTLNPRGTAIGQADTSIPDPSCPGCLLSHGFQWRNGVLTDLGALPGVNNSFAFWINSRGWVAGLSLNSVNDPLTGFPETDAVLWKDGNIIDLGTLGGSSSVANAVNNRGQVVGGALNTIPDPFSATFFNTFIQETFGFYFFPVATQSHAFLWQDGNMQDLGTLGGPDSVAWFVNELGQVAGQSTINSISSPTTGVPTVNPFFWDHGKMVDVGNFGGTFSFVAGLNNLGQMTGTMNLPGDSINHAFFWEHGVLTDLGTLGGDFGVPNAINDAGEVVGFTSNQGNQAVLATLWKAGVITNLGTVDGDQDSAAHSLNAKGQVVGESSPDLSFSFSSVHPFLWENGGPMVDLSTLVPPGSGLEVGAAAVSINDRGEIDGDRVLPNGDIHAFLLIPCDENHPNVEGCDYSLVDAVTEAQVRPAQSASSPAAGNFNKLSPAEMMTRFRSLSAGRNRHFGIPQTSPKAASSGEPTISDPTAGLSPTSLTFSAQAIGTTSAAKTVTLKNTGTTSLTITAIAIAGPNAGDFAQTHTCGTSLAAGASCSISVAFQPTASGARSAALRVSDNADGSPQQVALSGIGTTAKLFPTSLNFGTVAIGTTSPAKSVTLTNVGTTTISIAGISITGTNAGDFAQTHTCGSSMAAGATCSISITFKPAASGTRTAALSVSDNAAGSPQTVSLMGNCPGGFCLQFNQPCFPQGVPCCPGLRCLPIGTRAFCER